jgi:hypothetical protein
MVHQFYYSILKLEFQILGDFVAFSGTWLLRSSNRAALRNLAPKALKNIAAPVVERILTIRAAMANPGHFWSF